MHLLPQAENRLLKKKKWVKAKLLSWVFLCLAYALHPCSVPPPRVFPLGSGVVLADQCHPCRPWWWQAGEWGLGTKGLL